MAGILSLALATVRSAALEQGHSGSLVDIGSVQNTVAQRVGSGSEKFKRQ